MEQCSRQCIRRTFYAVTIGVSPILICLLFLGIARLLLYRLEIFYYRRLKKVDRRKSLALYKSGRLALSYTPVSDAELQRIIQGEYQNQQTNQSLCTQNSINSTGTKAPRFIKSILLRREQSTPSSGILANLVIRRDAIDASPLTGVFGPLQTPLQPTFSIINEQEQALSNTFTVGRNSISTTTLSTTNSNNNNNNNNGNSLDANDLNEFEQITNDPSMTETKTTTQQTVCVDEFLEFHSAKSLPCVLTLFNSVSENDDVVNSEMNKGNQQV